METDRTSEPANGDDSAGKEVKVNPRFLFDRYFEI